MYSKFFKHADVLELQLDLDNFLRDLDEVTGQVNNLEILHTPDAIIVLVIYSCWKKL